MDIKNLIGGLQSLACEKSEIRSALSSINSGFNATFIACYDETCAPKKDPTLDIESVLDFLHDELNTGHWSDISIQLRRAFTAASYVKALIVVQQSSAVTKDVLQQCLKTVDMGLLLGAPLEVNADLMTSCATLLSQQLATFKDCTTSGHKKRKLQAVQVPHRLTSLKGSFVEVLSRPSLEAFNKYFTGKLPVKLQECVSHWPALTKWPNVDYLLQVAGSRTVPVEIGSHYTDEDWRQQLMTLKDFIKSHFLEDSPTIGYLAQHNLFNQIPELRNDIYIPEYCCLSDLEDDTDDPDINAWFGPAGTVSPLHHDPKNNLLVQVFGTKQLVLYSPRDSPFLYPHEGAMLSNTAQVDPFEPDLDKFPDFPIAIGYKCLLEPGEMIYIPPKWWHHVTALDKSFSVSFWWN